MLPSMRKQALDMIDRNEWLNADVIKYISIRMLYAAQA